MVRSRLVLISLGMMDTNCTNGRDAGTSTSATDVPRVIARVKDRNPAPKFITDE